MFTLVWECFVPSKKARSLIKLTEKCVEFIWVPEQEEAWQLLKEELIRVPIFVYPDPKEQFILNTDASGYGIRAMLSQVQDGRQRSLLMIARS